ncbi:MAG TPA: lysophospholipid acyltransferase family protein [Synergistaceae bacterium]|nr:lysophospholipid acyltransferase family protein [Synergistaceae bacterium]
MKNPKYWWFLLLFQKIVAIVPHSWGVALGGWMGFLLWAVDRSHVDAAESRCVRVLGVGVTLARSVVRRSYMNLGRGAAEFLRLPFMKNSLSRYVRVHGESNLAAAYAEGHGVILLTAHFGNWELAAARLAEMGYPMNAIGASQRHDALTDLIASLRESAGVRTLGKGFDLRRSLECLKEGELLGVLLDQDPREQGMVVPFLGIPASTPVGPVKMVHKRNARVVPLFIVRRKEGACHDLYLLPALEGDEGKPFGEDLEKSLTQCNDVLSSWIEKYPDHWMWLYPRWASTMEDKK